MDFMAMDMIYKLTIGLIVLIFIRVLLRLKDRYILGIKNFNDEILPIILSNPKATAIFFFGWFWCITYTITKIFIG